MAEDPQQAAPVRRLALVVAVAWLVGGGCASASALQKVLSMPGSACIVLGTGSCQVGPAPATPIPGLPQ